MMMSYSFSPVRTVHNDAPATFTLEPSSRLLEIASSGKLIFDLPELLRVRSKKILEWTENRASENDDCIKTVWTVSAPPTEPHRLSPSITIRQANRALKTLVTHQIVNKFPEGFGYYPECSIEFM